MGFLGDIVNKVTSYIPKVELPKISLPNPVALAESAAHAVKDSFVAATKPLVDLATAIPNRAPAALRAVENGFYNGVNAAADKLGGDLKRTGSVLERAGNALNGIVPFAGDVATLGKGAQALGTGIANAPENAVAATSEIANRVENMGTAAMGFLNQAKNFVADEANAAVAGAKEGVHLLEQGATGLYHAGQEYLSAVAHAVDYKENIDKLGVGDTYKLGVGGEASVEGIKVYGNGSVSVTKNEDGTYTASADGELGGGIYGEVGGKLGAKVDAEGSATLGLGGKVEMKFDNAEDAKKAAGIMLKQAAAAAVANPTGPLGPAGLIAAKALQPSGDELKFLGDHVSAVELRGNVAGDLAATLGVKGVVGADVSAGAKDEVSARVEFEHGKPPTVTIKQALSAELNGHVGLTIGNGKEGKEKSEGGLPGASGKVEVTASFEQKFELPESVDKSAFLKDPLGYTRQVAAQASKTEEDKVTLEVDASGGVLGSGGGAKTEVSFTAKPEDLVKSGFVQKALKGDFKGAMTAVGDKTEVEAKVTPYKTLGVSLSPEVSLMGFGVGVDLEATRQDMADKPTFEFKGNATEAATKLNSALQQYSPYLLNPGPVIIRG